MKTPQAYIDGTTALKSDERETHVQLQQIQITPLPKAESRPAYLFVKRCFDFIASFLGLVILSPVFLAIIIAIRSESKGKAIYTQTRIGKDGRMFKIYKFRSMVHNADEVMTRFTPEQKREFEVNFKLENDPRMTRSGMFLRTTSLDELPQLLNILKGDLSVVGPRPIVEREVYKYGGNAEKLFRVKPGLTGYWQVNGRNNTTYEERVGMDMFYIDNRNFSLDTKIFFKTFKVVISKKGAC
jgi:lipopolysaccharide/colanic/teichoic acid biosynthesis glycosyltransferase